VRDIEWSEQVQVRRRSPAWSADDEAVGIRDHVVWDGITLNEAVKRVMDLPTKERAELTIFAPSGAYSGTTTGNAGAVTVGQRLDHVADWNFPRGQMFHQAAGRSGA
jgi:hypothetical protein